MKKVILLILIVILSATSFFAQELRKKAEENPLDCGLFLLSKDADSVNYYFLPQRLIKLGRYDDALFVIDKDDNSYSRFDILTSISHNLIEANNLKEASRFLTKGFAVLRDEEEWTHDRAVASFVSSLVRANRSAEAFEILSHQEYDETKAEIFISLAETYFKLGEKEKGEKFLNDAFQLRSLLESHYLLQLLIISAKYAPQSAASFLQQTENDFLKVSDEKERNRDIFNLIEYHFKIKQNQKAFELWEKFRDKENQIDSLVLVLRLLVNNDKENAATLFKKIKLNESELSKYNEVLSNIYLKMDDVKSALEVAQSMSKGVDNYYQQEAFMRITDKFISEGNIHETLKLLDFAYQRAAKVDEIHLPQHSIGASPLTRKIIYLRKIKERYFKLKMFEKGLSVLKALKIRDSHYQEFFAEILIDFTRQQLTTLSRKQIDENLKKAKNIFDKDEYYDRMEATAMIAEVYAQFGDKETAVEYIVKVLEEAYFENYHQEEFLIFTGEIFEKYQLKPTPNLKKVLRNIITTKS